MTTAYDINMKFMNSNRKFFDEVLMNEEKRKKLNTIYKIPDQRYKHPKRKDVYVLLKYENNNCRILEVFENRQCAYLRKVQLKLFCRSFGTDLTFHVIKKRLILNETL